MKGPLLLALLIGALPSAGRACTVWTVPSRDQAVRASDLVVEGVGQFPQQAGEGTITVAKTLRGKAPASLKVTSRESSPRISALCASPVSLTGSHPGTFYLVKLDSGRFEILRFEARAQS